MSDDHDIEGADCNNNNQPLERAEGEAVAIRKIMGDGWCGRHLDDNASDVIAVE